MDPERLQLLLQRHFDQMLTRGERVELGAMLRESARAREEFWAMARWNSLLRRWGEESWGAQESPQNHPVEPVSGWTFAGAMMSGWRRIGGGWLAAACALVLLAGVWVFVNGGMLHRAPANVAVLARSCDVVWMEGGHPWQPGQAMPPGWLRLQSGAAQVDLTRGGRVVVEGPAELNLVSDNEVYLRSGKLRAVVPKPAAGFKLVAPAFSVTDRGTEFGCQVAGTNGAEVHVFEGIVDFQPANAGSGSRLLHGNEALQYLHGQQKRMPADRAAFLGEADLALREIARNRDRLAAWHQASRLLSAHPQMLMYLDFEAFDALGQVLSNRAVGALPDSAASIIGCGSVPGRWPGKRGLEFNKPDDRLRMVFPGAYSSVTLMAWVRVDGLANVQNSLLMTESFLPGEIHWYLYHDGRLGLGMHLAKDDPRGWNYLHSDPVITAETLGSWVFLACVVDSSQDRVTHYFNGRPVGTGTPGIHLPVRFDCFEIGNWGVRPDDSRWPGLKLRGPKDHIRHFSGRMDEFAVVGDALTPGEIGLLYEAGRPGVPERLARVAASGAAPSVR
jgi:hypothetical protein